MSDAARVALRNFRLQFVLQEFIGQDQGADGRAEIAPLAAMACWSAAASNRSGDPERANFGPRAERVRRKGAIARPAVTVIYMDVRCIYGPCPQGVQMDFGFVASLLIAILAIVSVFVEIPIVSDYAFWVMTGAFLLVVGFGYDRGRKRK